MVQQHGRKGATTGLLCLGWVPANAEAAALMFEDTKKSLGSSDAFPSQSGACGGGQKFLASVQPSPLEGRLQAPQERALWHLGIILCMALATKKGNEKESEVIHGPF